MSDPTATDTFVQAVELQILSLDASHEVELAQVRLQRAQEILDSRIETGSVFATHYAAASAAFEAAKTAFEEAQRKYLPVQAAVDIARELVTSAQSQLAQARNKEKTIRNKISGVELVSRATLILPRDILGIIFQLCIDKAGASSHRLHQDPELVRKRQLQPFQLAATCKLWRDVCVSTLHLWTTVEVSLDIITASRADVWCDYVSTVLERSRGRRLSIRISRRRFNRKYDKQILNTLKREIRRCASLYIDVDALDYTDDGIVPILLAETPRLRQLRLFVRHANEEVAGMDLLPQTPNLEHAWLDSPFTSRMALCSVSNLHLFNVVYSKTRDEFCVLDSLSKLTTLSLSNPIFHDRPLSMRICESVTTLRLTQSETTSYISFLPMLLSFPELLDLHVGATDSDAGRACIGYIHSVVAQSRKLQRLFVSDILHTDEEMSSFIKIIPKCPTLETLTIAQSYFTKSSLAKLCEVIECPQATSFVKSPSRSSIRVLKIEDSCKFSPDCDQGRLRRLVSVVYREIRS